jgi:hypothetical protein
VRNLSGLERRDVRYAHSREAAPLRDGWVRSVPRVPIGNVARVTGWVHQLKTIPEESDMIITKARAALTVAAASLGLAALASPAMAADNNKHGTPGAVKAYNWDIPAGTASPSA